MALIHDQRVHRSPKRGRGQPSKRAILVTSLAGVVAAYVNVSVLALAIGELSSDLAVEPITMAWVVTAPMLAFAVLAPTAGKLADLYGRRRVFLIGLAGCGIFAAAAAAATSALALILLRTISSVFGASTAPAGMAMISSVYPREQRAKALGYWGLAMAGGPTVGMLAGGALLDYASWRWLFILQVPLVVVAFAVAWVNLPASERAADVRFDTRGTVLLALVTGGLVFAINRAPTWGWTHPAVVALLVAAPLAAWAFVRQERTCPHPLIPVSYFRSRNFSGSMAGLLLISIAYQGGFVVLPLMMREVLDYSNGRISLVSLARPLFYGLAGPVAGYLAVRLGDRRAAMGGGIAVALSCLALAVIGPGTSDAYIFGALALAGAGFGGMFPPITAAVTKSVAEKDLGVAGAASSMMVQIGMVVGIQLHQTVQESRETATGLLDSYHQAFLVGAGVAVVALLVVSQMRDVMPELMAGSTRSRMISAAAEAQSQRPIPALDSDMIISRTSAPMNGHTPPGLHDPPELADLPTTHRPIPEILLDLAAGTGTGSAP